MKIAITGKMCSGKSSIANLLVEEDNRFQIYSFGQKVKDVAKDLFNMKEKDRTLLTSIGTKMREINPDVWVNYVIQQTEGETHCIVDDLRYQNEYLALAENGWKIIQLTISDDLQEKRIKEIYPQNYEDHLKNRTHLSERNVFEWLNEGPDLVIDSSMNQDEIKKIVRSFISK